MKQTRWLALVWVVLAVVVAGCVGGKGTPVRGKGGLVVKIQVPSQLLAVAKNVQHQALTLAKLTVTLRKTGSQTQTQVVDIAGNTVSVSFTSLDAGTWTVDVFAQDDGNIDVYSGSTIAEVVSGATATATVTLALQKADLNVSVTIPAGSDVASGTVTLVSVGGTDVSKALTLSPGGTTGTAAFTGLTPGIWPIRVELFDAASARVADGEATVDLYPGKVNEITISLTGSGDLDIEVTWQVAPAAPTGLFAAIDKGIRLDWTGSGGGIAGYSVYRSTSETGPKQLVSSGLVTGTSFTDAPVMGGNTYWYWAVAHDVEGLKSEFSAPASIAVHVNTRPVVALGVNPDSGVVPAIITYTATAADPDSDPLGYRWTFGGTTTSGGTTETRTYAFPGTYQASVTVSDGLGGTATAAKSVLVRGLTATIPGSFSDVSVSGNRLALATGTSSVPIYDVSYPEGPVLLGSAEGTIDDHAERVAVAGNYLYVANYYDTGVTDTRRYQIVTYDISGPSPVETGRLALGGNIPNENNDLVAYGGYLYLARAGGYLQVLSLANPAAPSSVRTSLFAGGCKGLATAGNYLFVATGSSGIVITDITNPTVNAVVGAYDTPGTANGVSARGNYAYVADGTNLYVINVSNPYTPALAGSLAMTSASDVWASGTAVFVAGGSHLKVVDVSDPTAPALMGDIPLGLIKSLTGSGEYAYLADGQGRVVFAGP